MGVAPDYFLDKMTQKEVLAIITANNEKDKVEWEKVRMMAYYSVVAVNGSKQIRKPSDLFKFPWEQKGKPVKKVGKTLSKEEFNKLADKINDIQHGKKRDSGRC